MKQILTFIFLLIINTSYAQTWEWAKSAKGELSEFGSTVAVDQQGNTYVAGGFTSVSLSFGNITLTNSDTINTGTSGFSYDAFLTKYDTYGNEIWAKHISGLDNKNESLKDMVIDNEGNIYLVGNFDGPISFDNISLTSNGENDGFVVKYNSDGEALWARNIGGSATDIAYSIAIDNYSNIYITGNFRSLIMSIGSTDLTNNNSFTDIFIVKYDNLGNVLWAKSEGGIGFDSGTSIAVDANNNIYIAGRFSSKTITFDSTTLTNTWVDEQTFQLDDIFFTKYNESGEILWAKGIKGSGIDDTGSISIDNNGDIYLVGSFNGVYIQFDQIKLQTPFITEHTFIAKYNDSGQVLWGKIGGSNPYDVSSGKSIATDDLGYVYITGRFSSPSITFGDTILTNIGKNDMYIVQYNSEGIVQWASTHGGADYDDAYAIMVDNNNNVYLTGYYKKSCTFGSISLTNDKSGGSFFIAKLKPIISGNNKLKDDKFDLLVFPNPSDGNINIEFVTKRADKTKFNLTIYNSLGEAVYFSEFVFQRSNNIDLTDLPKGIYFINIDSDKKRTTQRFIIK